MDHPVPSEKGKRFVAVLNEKIDVGKLMNALGHMTVGMGGGLGKHEEMYFWRYEDKDKEVHPGISYYPFIVLAAKNGNQIRGLREEAIARGIPYTDFSNPMTIGTSEDQVAMMAQTTEADLEYYGVCLFGENEVLKEITKKFSLFK